MHYPYVLIGASVVTATVLGAFLLAYPPEAEPAAHIEPAEPCVYTPSDITKANPNIRASGGHGSWRTTDISDVAYAVDYTLCGTVLEIREPIDWYSWDRAASGRGAIPVVMSVDEVYKGVLESETLTFFLDSMIVYPNTTVYLDDTIADVAGKPKEYMVFGFEPLVEVGDHVLMHLSELHFGENRIIDPQDREALTPYYVATLGKYAAYHIHDGKIYNENVPDGAPLARAIAESQTAG